MQEMPSAEDVNDKGKTSDCGVSQVSNPFSLPSSAYSVLNHDSLTFPWLESELNRFPSTEDRGLIDKRRALPALMWRTWPLLRLMLVAR